MGAEYKLFQLLYVISHLSSIQRIHSNIGEIKGDNAGRTDTLNICRGRDLSNSMEFALTRRKRFKGSYWIKSMRIQIYSVSTLSMRNFRHCPHIYSQHARFHRDRSPHQVLDLTGSLAAPDHPPLLTSTFKWEISRSEYVVSKY